MTARDSTQVRRQLTELKSLDAGVRAFLPILYMAWADGELKPEEVRAVRDTIARQPWLDTSARAWLDQWLDPSSPPTAETLETLRLTVQTLAAEGPARGRASASELGMALATGSSVDGSALKTVEQSLGLEGVDAAAAFTVPESSPRPEQDAPPPFDVARLTALLDGEYADIRAKLRGVLVGPAFHRDPELPRAEYREKVLAWCQELARMGYGRLAYPKAHGGSDDLGRFIAVFEMLAYHDLSLTIKFGVQFGLFGGSIMFLGTERHHARYLSDVGTLTLPGGFAMTERDHGSNVRDIQTTARYDARTREFEIHTPHDGARKQYIGNAARHGQLMTVFAQLETGGVGYGVHAILVPVRNTDGSLKSGIRIEDDGLKLGLNGVDNGRIWFNHVRVPRENLLNRFADVSESGEYSSPIASPSKRFFTMVGTLVSGRVSVALASLSATKSALAIAIRYGAQRRQFGPEGGAETRLLDYLSHQRRLLPALATSYAIHFALQDLVHQFLARTESTQREVESLAAGLKAYATWHATHTIQTCREACGGQGYIAANRFASLKADTDVFTTFEGDNTVLMQLVARGLLSEYREHFSVLRYIARRAATTVADLDPVTPRLTDDDHLRSRAFQSEALQYRESRLLGSVARRLKAMIDDGQDALAAANAVQDHLLALAQAHVERVIGESFDAAVERCTEPPIRGALALLRDVFVLSRLEADRAWYLEAGYFAPGKSRAIRALLNRLLGELRGSAVPLVSAFGIPDALLDAPILSQ